jgi:hypothetical protein
VLALNKLWIPMPGYNFPKTGKRNLKFQYIWLLQYKWLCFSKKENGAYCKLCVFLVLIKVLEEATIKS